MYAAANEVCRAVISVNTRVWQLPTLSGMVCPRLSKASFAVDRVLLSVLGIARLSVAVLSRAIEESCLEETYRNGLYAEPCSGKLL